MPVYSVNDLRISKMLGGVGVSDNPEEYGEERRFKRGEATRVDCMGAGYLVEPGGSWTAGAGRIRVDGAYRIFDDTEGYVARKVINERELTNVGIGIVDLIDATLKKRQV